VPVFRAGFAALIDGEECTATGGVGIDVLLANLYLQQPQQRVRDSRLRQDAGFSGVLRVVVDVAQELGGGVAVLDGGHPSSPAWKHAPDRSATVYAAAAMLRASRRVSCATNSGVQFLEYGFPRS
jgi:hypothetical protein